MKKGIKAASFADMYGASRERALDLIPLPFPKNPTVSQHVKNVETYTANVTTITQVLEPNIVVIPPVDRSAFDDIKVNMLKFVDHMLVGKGLGVLPYQRAILEKLTMKPRYADAPNLYTRHEIVKMLSPDGEVVDVTYKNRSDFDKAGFFTIPEDACEVCYGSGRNKGETCWHCNGYGEDPVFVD